MVTIRDGLFLALLCIGFLGLGSALFGALNLIYRRLQKKDGR